MALPLTSTANYFITDEETGEQYSVFDGVVVGRIHGDHLFSEDPRMSGMHARFHVEGIEVYVEDIGSRNGVSVNGDLIDKTKPARLLPGDMIAMGNHVFCLGRSTGTPAAHIKTKPLESTQTEVLPHNAPPAPAKQAKKKTLHVVEPAHEEPPPPPTKKTKVKPASAVNIPVEPPPIEKPKRQEQRAVFSPPPPTPTPDMIRFEQQEVVGGHEQSAAGRNDSLLYMLLSIFALTHVLVIIRGGHPLHPVIHDLARVGANQPQLTLGGEWWRVISSLFVHAGLVQLVANSAAIWMVVSTLGSAMGSLACLTVFLGAGAVGATASLALQPEISTVGSTGAVFGLYGALLAILFQRRIPIEIASKAALVLVTATFTAANLELSLRSINDAAIATLCLVSGMAMGLLMMEAEATGVVKRLIRCTVSGLACAGIVWGGINYMPMPPPSSEPLQEVLREFLPLTARHDLLATRWMHAEIPDLEFSKDLRVELVPRIQALKKKMSALPAYQDERRDAASDLLLSLAAFEEAWSIRAQAVPIADSANMQKADTLQSAGLRHLDKASSQLEKWKGKSDL